MIPHKLLKTWLPDTFQTVRNYCPQTCGGHFLSPLGESVRCPVRRKKECNAGSPHSRAREIPVEPVLEMTGIDVDAYLSELRTVGTPAEVVSDIGAWLSGKTKRELGARRYQRAKYWLRHAQSQAIARRVRIPRSNDRCSATWFYSLPGRKDSVWHSANSGLLAS